MTGKEKFPLCRRDSVFGAVTAIQSAVDNLAAHPLVGRRIEGELRELIISYGHSVYISLYRFVVSRDEVRILAIRHQREVRFLGVDYVLCHAVIKP